MIDPVAEAAISIGARQCTARRVTPSSSSWRRASSRRATARRPRCTSASPISSHSTTRSARSCRRAVAAHKFTPARGRCTPTRSRRSAPPRSRRTAHGVRPLPPRRQRAAAAVRRFLGLSPLKLHVYDHCPFCTRAVLALGRAGVPYEKVVWGFGVGADPDSAGRGYDVGEGPAALTTKKGCQCSKARACRRRQASPGCRGRSKSSATPPRSPAARRASRRRRARRRRRVEEACRSPKLVRPRLLQMPTEDWKDPRDVEYATRAIMAQFGAILRAIL